MRRKVSKFNRDRKYAGDKRRNYQGRNQERSRHQRRRVPVTEGQESSRRKRSAAEGARIADEEDIAEDPTASRERAKIESNYIVKNQRANTGLLDK